MGKYQTDAENLLKFVGGKENIAAVTHCATRMRFVLNDPSKADEKAIENISAVKGMFTNAGQFQVIIGNDVSTFYNDFTAVSGIEGVSKEQGKVLAKQNQNVLQRVIAVLAEIFTPLLPAIIVGGLILGFRNLLEGVQIQALGEKIVEGVLETNADGTPIYNTIVDVSQFWSGVNHFLWLPGEAIFHFLPVGITWSVTRKMGTTQILGIILGITLVSPQLLNAYAVNSTSAADIAANWTWDFGFIQIDRIGYQAQVIPAMMAGFTLAYLEKFFRPKIPEAVSMIFVPLFSLLPAIFFAHTILGPIGWRLGTGISYIVNAGLESPISWLFSAVFGAVYAPLVITGLHHTAIAIDTQLIADFGTTNLWPMIALSNIAQGAAVFAVLFLHRQDTKEKEISLPSGISSWLGVTEPAMFGINLKYVYPFVAAMIGSGLAGMFSNITGVRANAIGVGGLPGILAINGNIGGGWLAFLGAMAIAIVVPFLLTIFFRQQGIFNKIDRVGEQAVTAEGLVVEDTPEAVESTVSAEPVTEELFATANGTVVAITEVSDPVFSQKMMGDGFAVRPTDNHVYSPVHGTVTSVFDTQHAIGILTPGGAEVLVHMGLDTVELQGAPFTVKVKAGDKVTPNTEIAEMDLEAVKAAGKQTDILTVWTNADKVARLEISHLGETTAKKAIGEADIS
ncbi:PTS system trehalose-specific EIIBC component [Enterococcus olivae]